MARLIKPSILPAADLSALEEFTRTGRRSVRPVRRTQALLVLATGNGQQAAGRTVELSIKLSARYADAMRKLAGSTG